jgi:SWI/SNF-related matrix-associated actin-dependent regulator 1 of chromatin subfamily A
MDLRNWYTTKFQEPQTEDHPDLLSLRKLALERKKKFLSGNLEATQAETPKKSSSKLKIQLELSGHNEISLTSDHLPSPSLQEKLKTLSGTAKESNLTWVFPLISYQRLRAILSINNEVEFSDIPRFLSQIISEFNKTCDFQGLDPQSSKPSEILKALPEELVNKMYEFQRQGVQFVFDKGGRALIGDEMGVGKTLQGIASAFLYFHEWPLLVICPASLKVNWRDEILKWLPSLSRKEIYLLDSKIHPSPFAKVWITSYNLATNCESLLKSQVFDVIIADECHYLKNYSAKRSKVIIPMLQRAKRAILISGTPVISRPAEIYNILTSLRPDIFRSFIEFAKRYCDPKEKFGHVDYSGSSNMKELYNLLSSTIMIRRLKSDVLTQLPSKIRQKIEIGVDTSSCKLIRKNFTLVKKSENKKSKDPSTKEKIETDKNQFIVDSYSLTARAKIKGVIDYITYLLENDCKFLIFAHHKEMMQAIQETVEKSNIHYIRIDGQTPNERRSAGVNEFQNNDNCKVAILSILAAGVGLTLTAGNLVVIAEMAWSPAVMIQAEDRVHRIGQAKSVNIHYLFGPGTLDEYIWPMIHSKLSIISSTLDNDENPETHSLMNPSLRSGIGDLSEIFKEIEKVSNN